MELQMIINVLKKELPKKVVDISESLELVREVLNSTYEEVAEKISKSVTNKSFDDMQKYSNLAQDINQVEEILNDLIIRLEIEDDYLEDPFIEENEKRALPNYEEYMVDNNVEHTLYENFTHKRPYGFKIKDSQLILSHTWQDMFVKLGEILIELNEDKFMNFAEMPSMNGKKRRYFSFDKEELRKPKMIANKIYVETNQSSNAIRNLIIKMLKKFNYNINDFKVYFRADYSSLNDQ